MYLTADLLESLLCSPQFVMKFKKLYPGGTSVDQQFMDKVVDIFPFNWALRNLLTLEESKKFFILDDPHWYEYANSLDIKKYNRARARIFVQIVSQSVLGERDT